MKKIFFAIMVLVWMFALTGCFHEHTFIEANCITPKTCAECGETDGEPFGHTWKIATCTTPETCEHCGETQGNALGHTWEAATCIWPETCSKCEMTRGEALGHSWENATCTSPKTCTRCSTTSGNSLGHNWKNATCTAPKTCSRCSVTSGSSLGHSWNSATCTSPKKCSRCSTTSGTTIAHKENSQGYCSMCGKDILLQTLKDKLLVELIVPSVGTTNYYCQMKVTNRTNYDVVLDMAFLPTNGKMFTNLKVDTTLKSGYYVVLPFYRSVVDPYNSKYKDAYLDNMSEAYYNFDINGKTVFVKFGVNGSIRWGYSLAEIGVY